MINSKDAARYFRDLSTLNTEDPLAPAFANLQDHLRDTDYAHELLASTGPDLIVSLNEVRDEDWNEFFLLGRKSSSLALPVSWIEFKGFQYFWVSQPGDVAKRLALAIFEIPA